ncbi:putative amino acid permease 7 [Camellia lanceoleosa]|uniref:Amino acid permease 7 n=1 Tax=Camellia lanceoleosa TaxID=1840588 RepID=A0ACC0HCB6_9ERIC|nr:putative amino acid permease 7 [Camellia lanceoleosa]
MGEGEGEGDEGQDHQTPLVDSSIDRTGKRSAAVCSVFLRLNFLKVGVVYTITSAISMRAIQKSNCYHKEGHEAACEYGSTSNYMLLFGIVQALMSQIPNFRNTEWLSIVAAAMSFSYATIGSVLGLAKVIEFFPFGNHNPSNSAFLLLIDLVNLLKQFVSTSKSGGKENSG